MGTKTAARLNLHQCNILIANNFLSRDQKKDYDHDEVIDRIIQLKSAKTERLVRGIMKHMALIPDADLPPPLPYQVMNQYAEEINF